MTQSIACEEGRHDLCMRRSCSCYCDHAKRSDKAPVVELPPAVKVEQTLATSPIEKLKLAPNVRRDVSSVDELAGSIRRFGILEPLIVCTNGGDDFEVIAGQRRLTAARVAGLEEVPVVIRPRPSPADRVLLQLAENLERKEMTPIEEAVAFKQLTDGGMHQIQVAAAISRSQAFVSFRIQLLDCPKVLQAALHERRVTPTVALSVPRTFYDDKAAVARLTDALDITGDANAALRSWAHDESRRAHAAGKTVTAAYALERPISLPVEYVDLAKEAAHAAGKATREWIRDAIVEKARRRGITLPDHVLAAKRVTRAARER